MRVPAAAGCWPVVRCHVDAAGVVALVGDGDRAGRAGPVLVDDQVKLSGARALFGVGILAVREDHDAGVLLHGAAIT